ncbi:MAG TPA: IS200/IS605 family transposase [Chthonomonadaceae bacterium]|nr:IS200/IS605 family transposase [Chthonomonadaceae bacterium]
MGQNKLRAFLHFIWATHDRLPLITEEIERDLYRYISAVCRDDQCEVLAIGGMPDHVHLLVGLSNTISLADLMKHVKGGSSRFVTQKLKPGEWFAWQSSYAVFAVSPRDKKMVIGYIQNQKRHHAENTLWPEAETTEEDAETNN